MTNLIPFEEFISQAIPKLGEILTFFDSTIKLDHIMTKKMFLILGKEVISCLQILSQDGCFKSGWGLFFKAIHPRNQRCGQLIQKFGSSLFSSPYFSVGAIHIADRIVKSSL